MEHDEDPSTRRVPPGGWLQVRAVSTAESARIVDEAAVDRVLVHGSPPGEGRDLDLLVRPESERAIASALVAHGFVQAGHRFVRFGRGTGEQVELYPAASWGLPPDRVAELFADGVPIDGYARLVRPSPPDTLLILARRVVEGVGVLDEKRRRYVDWAVAQDPKAWDHAAARAEAWHGLRSIELLERLVGRGFLSRATRAKVVDARLRASGHPDLEAHLQALRRVAPPRRRPVVVAISGLDGSGKSTQARLLVDTFDRIGIPAAMEWAKLGHDRRLWVLHRWGRRVLEPVARVRGLRAGRGGSARTGTPPPEGGELDAARRLRRESRGLTVLWANIAVASVIWTYRRQVARYRGHAALLVYDRYVLDSSAHARWRYALDERPARAVANRLARGAPRPLCAFFLALDPEAAQQRKLEDRVEDLAAHAAAYREALGGAAGRGVVVLDATRAPEDLAAEIARTVFSAYEQAGEARRRSGPLRRLARRARS